MEYLYLVPIADLHIGDPFFDEQKFLDLRNWVVSESNAYAVLLGDILNAATRTSISDIYSEKLNPQQALDTALQLLQPLQGKILGVVSGNHEFRIWRESGIDVLKLLAKELGAPYDPNGLLLQIKLGEYQRGNRLNYTCYVTHGSGAGRTIGGKAIALDRLKDIVIADVYCVAHTHGPMVFSDYIYLPDVRHERVEKKKRLFVLTGSFLNWGGYAERSSYRPLKTGIVRVRLDGNRKDYHASL